jgi:hypothetical protein
VTRIQREGAEKQRRKGRTHKAKKWMAKKWNWFDGRKMGVKDEEWHSGNYLLGRTCAL